MKISNEEHSAQVIAVRNLSQRHPGVCASLLGVLSVSAQRFPCAPYTTADGLPRDLLLRIVRDSHGFLWFCTADGLSRFNGYEFANYGVEQGLPNPVINDFARDAARSLLGRNQRRRRARFNPSPLGNGQPQIRNLFNAYRVGDERQPIS